MSGLFPMRQSVELDEGREPRLVELDEEVADDVFSALSSATTRKIFALLHEEPRTASDLAAAIDTSVQNVQYHLEKLTDADLIEVVDTWYSERGTEMKVYAPTDESLVLFAGSDADSSLRRLLSRIVGVLALLLPGSAAAGWLATRVGGFGGTDARPEAPEGPGVMTATDQAANEAAGVLAGLDPALVAGGAFFLGGVFVLGVALVLTRYR